MPLCAQPTWDGAKYMAKAGTSDARAAKTKTAFVFGDNKLKELELQLKINLTKLLSYPEAIAAENGWVDELFRLLDEVRRSASAKVEVGMQDYEDLVCFCQ